MKNLEVHEVTELLLEHRAELKRYKDGIGKLQHDLDMSIKDFLRVGYYKNYKSDITKILNKYQGLSELSLRSRYKILKDLEMD